MHAIGLMLFGALGACSGKDTTGETGHTGDTSETGADDSGHDTQGETADSSEPTLAFELALVTFEGRDPFSGITWTSDSGVSVTTDDDGEAELDLPLDAQSAWTASITGYPDLRDVFNTDRTWSNSFSQRQYLPAASTVDVTLDTTKGNIFLDVYSVTITDGSPDTSTLPGVGASLDQDAGAAYVPDFTSSVGLTAGSETLDGGAKGSAIYLFNVPTGERTLTLTAPDGMSCGVGPAVETASSVAVEVSANTTTRMMILCH